MCLLLATIHSTFSQSTLLSGYAVSFYWWKNRQKEMKWSAQDKQPGTPPFQNPWDCYFLPAQRGACRSSTELGCRWLFGLYFCSLKVSGLRSVTSSQLPLWPLFQAAAGITSRGQTFGSVFCPLTQTDFEMTGFMFKGGSPGTIWHAPCLLGDLSPLWHLTESFS